MRYIAGFSIRSNSSVHDVLKAWIICAILILSIGTSSMFLLNGDAGPIITDEYWEDTFDDETGIESSYNVVVNNSDVKLKAFRNDFDQDPLNQLPVGWTREFSDGNYIRVLDDPHEPGRAFLMHCNDYSSSLAWQRLWKEFDEYFEIWEFDLTLWAISTYTERQGYFYVEFYDISSSVIHEVRYYWDDARSGTPASSVSLTAVDLGFVLSTGTSLDDKFLIYENISEDIDANSNVDLASVLASSITFRYGFYQDAGPGWDRWEQVWIDNMGIYNDVVGNLRSIKITLPPGCNWQAVNISKTEPNPDCDITISVLDGETNGVISGFEDIPLSSFDISTIDPLIHPTLKLYGNLTGTGNATPVLHDWKVTYYDISPPATPMGLTLSNPFTGYSLILSWLPNDEPDLAGYRIYFSMDGTNFIWLGDTSTHSVSFIHYGLSQGDTCYYKIAAVDSKGLFSPNTSVVFGIPDLDLDGDQIGNLVDEDDDGDTVPDIDDEFPLTDNEWIDTDSDGIGDNADYDDDDDGYDDTIDDFPLNITEWNDLDDDGIGDNFDTDRDGDGVPNIHDDFPEDPTEWEDTDSDGLGNNKDLDIDGDSVDNPNDDFPYDDTESNDLDDDGIGDNADTDRDGDGFSNSNDIFPDNPFEWQDTDSDGTGDNADLDDDGDDYLDVNDAFPYNSSEWWDLDNDGIGDNTDGDKDGDGVGNNADLFPSLSHEWEDYDLDGIGDNSDPDDDNDKHPDTDDDYPYDKSRWRRPNELLFWLYIIIVLLIILILICLMILRSKEEQDAQSDERFFDLDKRGASETGQQVPESSDEIVQKESSPEPGEDEPEPQVPESSKDEASADPSSKPVKEDLSPPTSTE